MDLGFTNGLMVENMKDIGNKTKWMEKVNIHGKMEDDMKVNIDMIKNKDLEFIDGLMVGLIKVIGKMGSNMVKVK